MPMRPQKNTTLVGNRGCYQVGYLLSEGHMSWIAKAYEVETDRSVMLECFKTPTSRERWCRDYVSYARELNKRLRTSPAEQCCVLCNDVFEACPDEALSPVRCVYQVFPNLGRTQDLRSILRKYEFSWASRLKIARLLISNVCKIHEAGVVHGDLKPENLLWYHCDESFELVGVLIKGFEFSLMDGVEAPWTTGADLVGYLCTSGYASPEHLRGERPVAASDVFALSIVLCELLCGSHPLAGVADDFDEYRRAVLSGHGFAPLVFKNDHSGEAREDERRFAAALRRALSLNPAERPTCSELLRLLPTVQRVQKAVEQPRRRFLRSVDLTFLVDSSASMLDCIAPIRKRIAELAAYIATPHYTRSLMNWRIRVCSYRDFTYDASAGREYMTLRPFVRNVSEVQAQLSAIKAQGGMPGISSLFDALYVLASGASTWFEDDESPALWRPRSKALRCIIAITNAPAYPQMTALSGAEGGTVDDVIMALQEEGIELFLLAPLCICYAELAGAERSIYEPLLQSDGQTTNEALCDFLSDASALHRIVEHLTVIRS